MPGLNFDMLSRYRGRFQRPRIGPAIQAHVLAPTVISTNWKKLIEWICPGGSPQPRSCRATCDPKSISYGEHNTSAVSGRST